MRSATRSAIILSILFFSFGAAPTSAETFDLHVRGFCPPSTNCGYASEAQYQAAVLDMVQEMNLQWAQSDFSFRPVIFPINTSDPQAVNVTSCDDSHSQNPRVCSNDIDQSCNDDGDCSGSGVCEPRKVCGNDFNVGCSNDLDCALNGPGGFCRELNKQRRLRLIDLYSAPERDAITLFLFNTGNWCCSNPPSPGDSDASISSIFCNASGTVLGSGSVWAHEMGHYWCLRHTFTHLDFTDTLPDDPEHDGDASSNVFDTPADPSRPEGSDLSPRCFNTNAPCSNDGDCPGSACNRQVYRPGKEFCVAGQGSSDPGSYHANACTSTCSRCVGGECGNSNPGTLSSIPFDPFEHNSMSYYGGNCVGPFTENGQIRAPFTADQLDEIATCRVSWQRRIDLPDVCANLGGDTDSDGICDLDDNCPVIDNTDQDDLDGDGIGDPCDLCPLDPTPTGDVDGDGIGDVCDPDIDNDGCLNDDDQNPNDASVKIGTVEVILCGNGGDKYGFEGNDADGDGLLNCEDSDDDDDGICDGAEQLPPGSTGAPLGCEPGPDPCPTQIGLLCNEIIPGNECLEPWFECLGTGCFEYLVTIESLINPDPTTRLTFENVQIFNTTLFLGAPAGMTPAQTAQQMAGLGAGTAFRGAAEAFRVDLWRQGDTDPIGTLISRYEPSEVTLGELFQGETIVLHYDVLDQQPTPVTIFTRHGVGADLGDVEPDRDGDGVPDYVDNCRDVDNDQSDVDADGFGDACDRDADNDGDVDDADVGLVTSCLGVDVTVDTPMAEPSDYDENAGLEELSSEEGPSAFALSEARRCLAADVNGTGAVDADDKGDTESAVGTFPGPSGQINRAPVAEAGPHQVVNCGSTVMLDASASYDPDGDPLTCAWQPSTCTIAVPTACQTTATCPPGGIHAIAVTVSDGTTSSTDGLLVDAQECSPGDLRRAEVRIDRGAAAGTVRVSWPESCRSGVDYAIYEGPLGDWDAHEARQCGDPEGDLTEEILPRNNNAFFLVVPMTDVYEGSFGTNGAGEPRPIPVGPRCRDAEALATCPTP